MKNFRLSFYSATILPQILETDNYRKYVGIFAKQMYWTDPASFTA